jgi:hypothetical protein
MGGLLNFDTGWWIPTLPSQITPGARADGINWLGDWLGMEVQCIFKHFIKKNTQSALAIRENIASNKQQPKI